jgi:hypothetical protein
MSDSEWPVDARRVHRGAGRRSQAQGMPGALPSLRTAIQRREARAWRGGNSESII